jgi:hypothetical protein
MARLTLFGLLFYVIAVLVSTVTGFWLAYEFTAHTIVPWMEVPHEWMKTASVLLTLFFTGPIGTSLVLTGFAIVAAILAFVGLRVRR